MDEKPGTPRWAFIFACVSLLAELLIELCSNWIEAALGSDQNRLVGAILVGSLVFVGLIVLAKKGG